MELDEILKLDTKHICNLTEMIKQKIREAIPIIRENINIILANRSTSVKDIERNLDFLLNVIPFGYGIDEFHRLLEYYSTINKKHSKFYFELFNKF